jgi:hypothetical protein
MNRKTFLDARLSRIPSSVGLCAADVPGTASYVNEAQQRLIIAGGETGWFGSWQKVAFAVDPSDSYLTLPRQIARIINLDVCNYPVRVQNEFYEFLEAGIGHQPSSPCACPAACQVLETFDRGVTPTFRDIIPTGNPKLVRIYATTNRDYGRRVLLQGLDTNGTVIRSLDNGVDVEGEFITLGAPFATSAFTYLKITGIQKDVTAGDVRFYEVDSVLGTQRSISLMEPSETVACYRRYFINGISNTCCACGTISGSICATPNPTPATASVLAMAKLEFIPVAVDTDYLLIGNLPALKLECMSVRLEESDEEKSFALSQKLHQQAIKLLNKELTHYTGRLMPATNFAPWGNAKLEYQRIGTLV